MSEGNEVAAVAQTAPAAVEAPDQKSRELLFAVGKVVLFGLLVGAALAWLAAHFGFNLLTASPIVICAAVITRVYSLFTTRHEKKDLPTPIRFFIAKWVDRLSGRRVIIGIGAVLFVLMSLITTIELPDLAEGTKITAPAFVGTETRTEIAAKNRALRLHFLGPFRAVEIRSDRHDPTPSRTWPVWPRTIYAAHLTPRTPAAVVVLLPLPAQKFLDAGEDGGEYVIDGKRHPVTDENGAVLIGDAELEADFDPELYRFGGTVPTEARETARRVWSKPLKVSAPPAKRFRIAYLVDGVEVAVADDVSLPQSGLKQVEMRWTYTR